MNKVLNRDIKAGSTRMKEPRQWKHNTDLCVDIKTLLRCDRIAKIGKSYYGVLKHDSEEHFTFNEVASLNAHGKRNPQVFVGKHITVTRRDDGTLRHNFRPVGMGHDFNIGDYASEVANEILWALTSLIGK